MPATGIDFAPPTHVGRRFESQTRIRLADLTDGGRLRLDAIARILQDVSADDTADAGVEQEAVWVLRRLALRIGRLPRYRDLIEARTWCSGVGPMWAERRTDLAVSGSLRVEAAALWASTDPATFAPTRLGAGFEKVFAPSAAGRRVSARLRLPDPPSRANGRAFAIRATDLDLLGHVNNAAYWASAEESLRDTAGHLTSATIEFRGGVDLGEPVEIVETRTPAHLSQWWVVDGAVRAALLVTCNP